MHRYSGIKKNYQPIITKWCTRNISITSSINTTHLRVTAATVFAVPDQSQVRRFYSSINNVIHTNSSSYRYNKLLPSYYSHTLVHPPLLPLHHQPSRRFFFGKNNSKQNSSAIASADVINPAHWSPSLGFYGSALRSPSDFKLLSHAAHTRVSALYELVIHTRPYSLQTLDRIDEMSNMLCAVIDVAECVRNTHPDLKWREAAIEASHYLHGYMTQLNSSKELYEAIVGVMKLPEFTDPKSSWTEEIRRSIILLKRDMDQQGIGAAPDLREQIESYVKLVHERIGNYVRIQNETSHESVIIMDAQLLMKSLRIAAGDKEQSAKNDSLLLRQFLGGWSSALKSSKHLDGTLKNFLLPITAADWLLIHVPNSTLRAQIYEQYNGEQATKSHGVALESLICARQALAQTLHRPSIAKQIVSLLVAKDDQHVRRLLKKVLQLVANYTKTAPTSSSTESSSLSSSTTATSADQQSLLYQFQRLKYIETANSINYDKAGGVVNNISPDTLQTDDAAAAAAAIDRDIRAMRIYPYDQLYFVQKLKEEQLQQTRSNKHVGQSSTSALYHLAPYYFTLPNILHGCTILCRELFGLRLRAVKCEKGESWLEHTGAANNDPDHDVIKLEIWQDERKPNTNTTVDGQVSQQQQPQQYAKLLGVIYLDLYNREDKFSNPASFIIRSGYLPLDPTTGHKYIGTDQQQQQHRQLPIVGIVTAWSTPTTLKEPIHPNQIYNRDEELLAPSDKCLPLPPPSSLSQGSAAIPYPAPRSLTLASHQDFVTFFHEFGHCFHNILSFTRNHHVAGGRGELDFVELPSTLFEKFMSSYNFISRWSYHVYYNKPISKATLAAVENQEHHRAGNIQELTRLAQVALFDQLIHGPENQVDETNNSKNTMTERMNKLWAEVQALDGFHETRSLPPAGPISTAAAASLPASSQPVYPYRRVLHLVTYCGSFYSYIYCRLFAAVIWRRHIMKQQQQLSSSNTDNNNTSTISSSDDGMTSRDITLTRAVGDKLRYELFAHGCGKAADQILAELADITTTNNSNNNHTDAADTDTTGGNITLQQWVEQQVPTFVSDTITQGK